MAAEVPDLKAGTDIFTCDGILKKAAGYKGLKLNEGSLGANSETIITYILDGELLDFLEKRGIKRQDRSDTHNTIFTIVDENPQKEVPGVGPSNYWNFKVSASNQGKQFNLRIDLRVFFRIHNRERGIALTPLAVGTFLSPCDHLPNFRMFKALVESSSGPLLPIVKEIAESDDGQAVVTWTDLGLGGIRSISDLFSEFVCGNKAISELARQGNVFNLDPFLRYRGSGGELFIAEPAQPKVFRMWKQQLEDYRDSLAL